MGSNICHAEIRNTNSIIDSDQKENVQEKIEEMFNT
jgi:hypothetical protein